MGGASEFLATATLGLSETYLPHSSPIANCGCCPRTVAKSKEKRAPSDYYSSVFAVGVGFF